MALPGVLGVSIVLVLAFEVALIVAARWGAGPPIASLAAHLLIGTVVYMSSGLYAPDARLYDTTAWQVAQHWAGESSAAPPITLGKEAFPLLLGAVYRLCGHEPLIGIYLNALACLALVAVVASAAERLGMSARGAAWITALYPPLLFWGSLLLREALTWLALAVVARSLAGMTKRVTQGDLLWLVVGLLGLFWIRGTVALLVVGGAVPGIVMARKHRRAAVVVVAVVIGIIFFGLLGGRVAQITDAYNLKFVNQSRAALATEASSGFAVVSFSGPLDMLRALPTILPRVAIRPFPWEWPGLNPALVVDAMCWLWLAWRSWGGFREVGRRQALVLVLPALVIGLALGAASGNYGTLQRLRLLPGIMLIPLAARRGGRPEDDVPIAAVPLPARGSTPVLPRRRRP